MIELSEKRRRGTHFKEEKNKIKQKLIIIKANQWENLRKFIWNREEFHLSPLHIKIDSIRYKLLLYFIFQYLL